MRVQIQNEEGEWTDLTGIVTDLTFSASLPAQVIHTLPPINAPGSFSFESSVPNKLFSELAQLFPQVWELEYRPGNKWFMPTIKLPQIQIATMFERTGANTTGEIVEMLFEAQGVVVEYHHWAARPVFWLWQRWRTVRRFIKGKLNARRTDD